MNKKTIALTEQQYIEIIKTMREGFLTSRPNERVAMALILEANLGIRISDIIKLKLNDIEILSKYYHSTNVELLYRYVRRKINE